MTPRGFLPCCRCLQARRAERAHAFVRGFSLVELLVAVALGMALACSVLPLLVASAQAQRLISLRVQMLRDAWIAMHLLKTALRAAATEVPAPDRDGAADGPLASAGPAEPAIFACDHGFAATSELACAAPRQGASAALRLRYSVDAARGTLDPRPARDCLGNARASPLADHAVGHDRYYISTGASGKPALHCAAAPGQGQGERPGQPLVENIESLALAWGVLDAPAPLARGLRWLSTDELHAVLRAGGAWKQVRSVRLTLRVRSDQPLDGAYLRQSLQSTVALCASPNP